MTPLRLTVPFHPADETPMSLVSRLAARNGTVARLFCMDFGLRFQAVVDGDSTTLRRLADLAAVDPQSLLGNALVKAGELRWTYRDQLLHRSALRRGLIAMCPKCALDDLEAQPNMRPQAAVYGRIAWLVEAVRTCQRHRIPLANSTKSRSAMYLHDFAYHVGADPAQLTKLATQLPKRDPGALENYVLGRLSPGATSSLLDRLPLASAVRLCETVGAVLISGPDVNLRTQSSEQRHAAGERGFAAVAAGEGAFRTLLDTLMKSAGSRLRLDGPAAAFERLHHLLCNTRRDPDFAQIRDIARSYVEEHFALPAGSTVYGKPIERRVHSIHTLAAKNAAHRKLVRKHLLAKGLITEAEASTKSDHQVRVEAAAAEEFARRLAATLSRSDAMERLGIPESQMRVLTARGFIAPEQSMAKFGGWDRYSIADLDGFMAKLTAAARTARVQGKLLNIPDAARENRCSAAHIVRFILDGKISVWIRSGLLGYMSILVASGEVAQAIGRPVLQSLPLRLAARAVGTSDNTLCRLIACGHIRTTTVQNALNGRPQEVVHPDDIQAFKAKYISLANLAKERKLGIGAMRKQMDEAGVKPAIDRDEVPARFYAREDIPKAKP